MLADIFYPPCVSAPPPRAGSARAMSVRIDIEGLNSQGFSCQGPRPVQVQETMPAPLASSMNAVSWKGFTQSVNTAIEGPAQTIQKQQRCTCILFAIKIGTFMTAFLSFPLGFLTAGITGGGSGGMGPNPLFFLPFITWPICFIILFVLGCYSSGTMEQLKTNLRAELERQSRQNQGISFHLREDQTVTYGHRRSHVQITYWIEACSAGIVSAQAIAMPAGYVQLPGAGGSSANVSERLSNLEDLKRKMLISEAEYQSKRAEVLSMV